MGQRKPGKMLQARQLPRHLDVGTRRPAVGDIEKVVPLRPAVSGLEIKLPIDRPVLRAADETPQPLRFRQVRRVNALR